MIVSSKAKPPIFVGGCPRSGTSLVAAFLDHLGLNTVPDSRANKNYPVGYREHLPLLMFHKAMERYPREQQAYRAENAIDKEPFLKREYLEDELVDILFRRAFAPVLTGDIDFLKFPQLALSSEFLLEEFPSGRLIIVWRNPVATFRSLVNKEFASYRLPASAIRAVLLWGMYAYHACAAVRRAPSRVAVLSVDRLISSEGNTLRRLLREWGYQIPKGVELGEVLDRDVWTFEPGSGWRVGYWVAQFLARAVGMVRGVYFERFSRVGFWRRNMEKISYDG